MTGHEPVHLEFQFFQNGNSFYQKVLTDRIGSIPAEPIDNALEKDAEKVVDNLIKPNQPQREKKTGDDD